VSRMPKADMRPFVHEEPDRYFVLIRGVDLAKPMCKASSGTAHPVPPCSRCSRCSSKVVFDARCHLM
jgi:hypothetical protein